MLDDINKNALMETGFPHFFQCVFPVLFHNVSWSQLRFCTGLPASLLSEVPNRLFPDLHSFPLTKQAKINFLAANSMPRINGQHAKDKTKIQKYINPI